MAAEVKIKQLSEKLVQQQGAAELELLRAVTEETRKWEARERQLVQQVDELKSWSPSEQANAVKQLSLCSNI